MEKVWARNRAIGFFCYCGSARKADWAPRAMGKTSLDFSGFERRQIVAEVEDYTSGKVLDGIKRIFDVLKSSGGSLKDAEIGKKLIEAMRKLDPTGLSADGASRLVRESNTCAVGERVCRALYKDSPCTESVFLDELAEGMVEAGKAKYVTKEEAIEVLQKYPKNPIVITRVSGKHAEICRHLAGKVHILELGKARVEMYRQTERTIKVL